MNIVVAEDHQLIIEGLQQLLSSQGHVVYPSLNRLAVLKLFREEAIDILIQDIRFGDTDGRELIKEIQLLYPQTKIIALTSHDDLGTIQSVLALKVNGYLIKSESSSVILEAINTVLERGNYLSPLTQSVLSGMHQSNDNIVLSEREKAVLQQILNEQSTKEIAATLFISEKTVEHYRSSLFTKFDVKNAAGLVKKAILLGFYQA